ncbi:cation transporter [Vogesella indigofera]
MNESNNSVAFVEPQSSHDRTATAHVLGYLRVAARPTCHADLGTAVLLKGASHAQSSDCGTYCPFAALASPPKTVTLEVKNMTCSLCPITVKKSLENMSGVSAVKVDGDKKTATVTFDPDKTQPEALTRATTNAGYSSTLPK